MKTIRMTIDPSIPASLVSGWIDSAGVDATSEEDIAKQEAADEAEATRVRQFPPSFDTRFQ
jgi:putative transcriptional regulator